jgi:ComF family protein
VLMATFSRLARGVADVVYPPLCIICGARLGHEERHVCAACLRRLPLIEGPRCPVCCRPIRTRGGSAQVCGACRLRPRRLIDRVAAAGEYQAGLKQLIHLYKYRHHQFLSRLLVNLVVRQARETGILEHADWLVPIPLHWTRKRWRGFNQALELARGLSGACGVPVMAPRSFRRVRRTTPQVRLNAPSRAANMKGAFAVRSPKLVHGARLVLIDDVLTTGATAEECARVLRHAGAVDVRLLTIAR